MNRTDRDDIRPFQITYGGTTGTATLTDTRDGSEVLKVEAKSYASAQRILSAVASREVTKIRRGH